MPIDRNPNPNPNPNPHPDPDPNPNPNPNPTRKKALRPSLLELFEHTAADGDDGGGGIRAASPTSPSRPDTLLHALARMPAVRPTDPWWNGTVRSATAALLALTQPYP